MGDGGVEDRRPQLEGALEGRVQVDECGRVGRVRFELELRVGRLLGKVDREGRVRRVRVDKEDAVCFVLVRGNQGEFGEDGAASVREGGRRAGICVNELAEWRREVRRKLTCCWCVSLLWWGRHCPH